MKSDADAATNFDIIKQWIDDYFTKNFGFSIKSDLTGIKNLNDSKILKITLSQNKPLVSTIVLFEKIVQYFKVTVPARFFTVNGRIDLTKKLTDSEFPGDFLFEITLLLSNYFYWLDTLTYIKPQEGQAPVLDQLSYIVDDAKHMLNNPQLYFQNC